VWEGEGMESHMVYIRDFYLDAVLFTKSTFFDVLFLKKYF
jgi:hypothetical protein